MKERFSELTDWSKQKSVDLTKKEGPTIVIVVIIVAICAVLLCCSFISSYFSAKKERKSIDKETTTKSQSSVHENNVSNIRNTSEFRSQFEKDTGITPRYIN